MRRSIGNVQLDYKLPFVPGLSANVNLGYDVQRGRGSLNAPTTAAAYFNQRGVNNFYRQDLDNTLLETYGKYERNFWQNSKVELLAGYSYQKFQNRNYIVNNNSADGTIFQQAAAPAYNGAVHDPEHERAGKLLLAFERGLLGKIPVHGHHSPGRYLPLRLQPAGEATSRRARLPGASRARIS
ncbi:MAG: hypothetical protein WKG07_42575 [Hymenobacter sp.]